MVTPTSNLPPNPLALKTFIPRVAEATVKRQHDDLFGRIIFQSFWQTIILLLKIFPIVIVFEAIQD